MSSSCVIQCIPYKFLALSKMAAKAKVTDPGLEQLVVERVKLIEKELGAGAYGSVEEVEIPGARVAAKKLHTNLINLGSPQQVLEDINLFQKLQV